MGDPSWPAEASRLMKSDRNIAAAINAASAFNSGLSEDRHRDLVMSAVVAHAPADAAAISQNAAIAEQADQMEAGLRQLGAVWFSSSNADRATASRVNPHEVLVPPAVA